MIYGLAKFICNVAFHTVVRRQVVGLENLPREGGVVLCSNHISNFDPPLIGSAMPRRIRFMAKDTLFTTPVVGWIVKDLGAFPVKRGAGDRQALRTAIQLVDDGEVLGVFPEGTRSKTGQVEQGQSGAAYFATRTKSSHVVPVAIIGRYKLFGRIKLVFGPPLDISAEREQGGKEALTLVTNKIMGAIEQLIREHS